MTHDDRHFVKVFRVLAIASMAMLLALSAVAAEDDDEQLLEGEVDVAYRSIDVDGSQRKYDEDFDGLDSGLFLAKLGLNWRSDSSPFADYAQLDVEGLGGEPYERSSLRLGRTDAFEFRFTQSRQRYIYDLFGLFGDEDGHQWDTDSRRTNVDLDLQVSDNATIVLGYDEWSRTGDFIYMRDFSRDVFLTESPVDRQTQVYSVGGEFEIGPTFLNVRQSLRRYAKNLDSFTEGDLGLSPGGASFVDFDWNQDEKSDSYLTTVNFTAPIGDRVRVNVGYYGTLFGDEEFESDVSFDATGTAFDGAPIDIENGFTRARIDRSLQLYDVDVSVRIARPLDFVVQYRDFTQESDGKGERDIEATGSVTAIDTRLDWNISTLTGLLQWTPRSTFSVRGGYRLIDRELTRDGFDTDPRNEDFSSDGDETFVFGLFWRPIDWVRFNADHEEGDIDRSFTLVSPLERSQTRARVTFTPREQMSLQLAYTDFENEKPTPDFAARSEGTSWSVAFTHEPIETWSYLLSYARNDLESEADVIFDGAGFGGPTAIIDGRTIFEGDTTVIEGAVRFQPSPAWRFVLSYLASDAEYTESSLGDDLNDPPAVPSILDITQDWMRAEARARYTFASGQFVGATVGAIDYDELNDDLDYDGVLLELHVGTNF